MKPKQLPSQKCKCHCHFHSTLGWCTCIDSIMSCSHCSPTPAKKINKNKFIKDAHHKEPEEDCPLCLAKKGKFDFQKEIKKTRELVRKIIREVKYGK